MLNSIKRTLARIWADILAQRNIEAYVVAALAIVLAVLGVGGDWVSPEVKLAVILAALGLLVFNLTVPEQEPLNLENVLVTRSTATPLLDRIKGAKTLWIYAAFPINMLNDATLHQIRQEILNKGGQVRVIMQDPSYPEAVNILKKQLLESLDFSFESYGEIETLAHITLERLKSVKTWKFTGTFELKLLQYGPGFALIVIDPYEKNGVVIPEIYGFHNEFYGSRMNLQLTRYLSEHWYNYWVSQFDYMWNEARKPGESHEPQS